MTDKKITDAIKLLQDNGYVFAKKSENHYNEEAYKAIFDMPLKEFLATYLPKGEVTRIYNLLNCKSDPETKFVGQLVGRTWGMISGYGNIGKRTMASLERALLKHVLWFSMNTNGWIPPETEEEKVEEKKEYPPLPDSYYLDYIKRFMPGVRYIMGANAAMLYKQVSKWPIFNDDETVALVVSAPVGSKEFMPVKYIGIGNDIRVYPRGLAVAELKSLMEDDWAQKPGEVRIGVEQGKMMGIKAITSVRPQVMEGGWMANEVVLLT